MRNLKSLKLFSLFVLFTSLVLARDTDKNTNDKNSRKKQLVQNGQLEANNVKANLANNGWLFWGGGDSGYITPHPTFSNNTENAATIFASGLWLSGFKDGVKRAAVANYSVDFTPGLYDEYVADSVANGQAKASYKIYYYYSQVHLQYLENLLNNTTDNKVLEWVKLELAKAALNDTNNWIANAVPQGAPRVPPGHHAAWTVYHDRGLAQRNASTGNTDNIPMNVQVRMLAFAFRTSNALNDNVFIKFEIINKHTSALSDMYATVWSDPDLGDATDDYVGSDPVLGLGYCYNGKTADKVYTGALGIDPPAAGYDFLQGPIVTNVGTKIIERGDGFKVYINYDNPGLFKDGDIVINDKKVLSATSFTYFNNGFDPKNPLEYYNMMQGFNKGGTLETQQIDAVNSGKTTLANQRWWFNGDPEGSPASNWIETEAPNDRRFMLNVGPFQLGVSDGTQKFGDPGYQSIVFAAFSAFGKSNRNSVSLLKFNDKAIQGAFNAGFDVLPTPPAPNVTVRLGNASLNFIWEEGSSTYKNNPIYTERFNVAGYKFEGYQIVQFESGNTANSNSFKVVNINDKNNGIGSVKANIIDDATGDVLLKTVIKGTDSGVKHDLEITRDLYSAITTQNMFNGVPYYFGIRAYAVNLNPPEGSDAVIFGEWASNMLNLKPQALLIGNEIKASFGQVLTTSQKTTDAVDSYVDAKVVDPLALKNASYEYKFSVSTTKKVQVGVTFGTKTDTIPSGTTVWSLYKDGVIVPSMSNLAQLGGPGEAFGYTHIFEGIAFTAHGPSLEWKSFQVVANGSGNLASPVAGAFHFQGFPTPGDADPVANVQQSTNAARWAIQLAESATDRGPYAIFIERVMRDGWGDIVPHDFEIRFEAPGAKARNFSTNAILDVPFSIWNKSLNVRLCPYVLEDDNNGAYNYSATAAGVERDHAASGGTNDPYTERIYVYLPGDMTAGQAGYDDWIATDAETGHEAWARMGFVNWNGGETTTDGPYNSLMPETGTIFRMVSTKPSLLTTVFQVTSPGAPTLRDNTLANKNIDAINVVPNPYYGSHSLEIKNDKFIRFTNLPQSANTADAVNNTKINIYNLSGDLVKTIVHNSINAEAKWSLTNNKGVAVASGVYIAHIVLPAGAVKVIKMIVLQSVQQISTF